MIGRSLLKNIKPDVEGLAKALGFQKNKDFLDGFLCLIDMFSSYHEEGVELYPEILIFECNKSDDIFKYISGERKIVVHENQELTASRFKKTIKSLAPLNQDDWISFFAISEDYKHFSAGIISVLENEISLPIQNQLLSFGTEFSVPFAIISCLGGRNVSIKGRGGIEFLISFSLKDESKILEFNLTHLVKVLFKEKEEDESGIFHLYASGIFQKSFRKGHGNLIGVIDDSPEALEKVKSILKGIFLSEPIDFYVKISNAYSTKNVEDNFDLRQHTGLLANVLNFDGIALFTTNFKLVGYNLFISGDNEETEDGGGARTRAYLTMIKSGCFAACFFKSQDGNEKIH